MQVRILPGSSPFLNLFLLQDTRIKRLLDTTDISLVPSLNPDGWDSAGKGDCNGSGKKHGMFNQASAHAQSRPPAQSDACAERCMHRVTL